MKILHIIWEMESAVLRWKFLVANAYGKKEHIK